MPKVGEYYYVSINRKEWNSPSSCSNKAFVILAKVVSTDGNNVIIMYNKYSPATDSVFNCMMIVDYTKLEYFKKWEPNWFWKILGYK